MLPESVGQLRRLYRAACVVCGTIRSQRCSRCGCCNSNTPLRELRVGDTFQDRRQAGHQNAAASTTATDLQPPQSSQPILQETSLTTARNQTAPPGHCLHRSRQAASRRASPSLRDGTSAVRGLSPRHGLGRVSRRIHERPAVLGFALSLPLPLAPC